MLWSGGSKLLGHCSDGRGWNQPSLVLLQTIVDPLCVCVSVCESIKMRLKRVVVSKSCSSCDSLRPKFSSLFGLWSSLFLRYSPRSCSKPKIRNTMEGKAVCHCMLQKKEKFTSCSHWQDLTQVTSYQPVSTQWIKASFLALIMTRL